MIKKVFNMDAWLVKDNGEQENVTDRILSDELKGEIIRNLTGEQVAHFWGMDKGEPIFLKTSVVVHCDGVLSLNIYETENAYLGYKNAYKNTNIGFYFNY